MHVYLFDNSLHCYVQLLTPLYIYVYVLCRYGVTVSVHSHVRHVRLVVGNFSPHWRDLHGHEHDCEFSNDKILMRF